MSAEGIPRVFMSDETKVKVDRELTWLGHIPCEQAKAQSQRRGRRGTAGVRWSSQNGASMVSATQLFRSVSFNFHSLGTFQCYFFFLIDL